MSFAKFEHLKPFALVNDFQKIPDGKGHVIRFYYVFVGVYFDGKWKASQEAFSCPVSTKETDIKKIDKQKILDKAWKKLVESSKKEKRLSKFQTVAPLLNIPDEYKNQLSWFVI